MSGRPLLGQAPVNQPLQVDRCHGHEQAVCLASAEADVKKRLSNYSSDDGTHTGFELGLCNFQSIPAYFTCARYAQLWFCLARVQ